MGKFYNSNYEERIEKEIRYICEDKFTVREIAELISVSKSTVHLDLTERLEKHSYADYLKVRKILDEHLEVRHLRGGEATRRKYKKMKGC